MSETTEAAYQVLARKYRPQTLADLIGQEAMVRVLRNAFAADRIAHAFILTGVRGVGKTTTARIIAKGLNCVGPDGQGGPTTEPCGRCEHCIAITEGRHVDVLEMDAASRTGVGDIREIIESVHYRAASARYKIYIIDEVHMLSTSAFNALLKTLEEPPAHVKFLFATTEIRKVPVTVLSRCQRFDLRRIEPEAMMAHLTRIADLEGVAVASDALALITRAAEGSVRDAMSLLDQAMATGPGETTAARVREMLGLADRGRTLDLFALIMQGRPREALGELAAQHAAGADPLVILRDLAEVTHWVSVLKVAPDAAGDPTASPDERARGLAMADELPMRALGRMWQMLLAAIDEVGLAPNALSAAEMAVIRLTHVADLPDPATLVKRLAESPQPGAPPSSSSSSSPPSGVSVSHPQTPAPGVPPGASRAAAAGGGSIPAPVPATPEPKMPPRMAAAPAPDRVVQGRLAGLADLLALIRAQRDLALLFEVESFVRPLACVSGRLEFEPAPGAAPDLAQRLKRRLQDWTGAPWAISVVAAGGAPTVTEWREAEARNNPVVQAVLAAFPGARVAAVREAGAGTELDAPAGTFVRAPGGANDEDVSEDWDPFED